MSEFKRSARVAEGVREALSAILAEGLKDPDVGYITVTDVQMTDDLRQAKVFVSVYGELPTQKKSLTALARAAPYLRRELASRLRLRFSPELVFGLDETIAQGARIEKLLQRIGEGNTADLTVEPMPQALPIRSDRDLEPVVVAPPPPPPPKKKSTKKRRR